MKIALLCIILNCFFLTAIAQSSLRDTLPKDVSIPGILRQHIPSPNAITNEVGPPSWLTHIQRSNASPKRIGPGQIASAPITMVQKIARASKAAGAPNVVRAKKNIVLDDAKSCRDSSFIRLIGATNCRIYPQCTAHTADNGVIMGGQLYDSTILHDFWRSKAFLIKSDSDGNVLWAKTFVDHNSANMFSYINITKVVELSNKDLIALAYIDTTNGNQNVSLVLRLTPQGDIVWYTTLLTHMTYSGYAEWMYVSLRDVAEGINGEFILTGTTFGANSGPESETIIRMDQAGSVIWDVNINNEGYGAEGLHSYVENGKINFTGIMHTDYHNYEGLQFATLDYATGALLDKKFFVMDYPDPFIRMYKQFSYYYNYVARLSNGHIVIYGPVSPAYAPSTDSLDYFAYAEFDEQHNFVKGSTIASSLHLNNYNINMYVDDKGGGIFTVSQNTNGFDEDLYYASLRNGRLARQRIVFYTGGEFPGYVNSFCSLTEGGYILNNSFYKPGKGYSVDFMKVHDTDSATDCLGKDSLFVYQRPLNVIADPGYYDPSQLYNNQLEVAHYDISQADVTTNTTNPACPQRSYCDTLKIHGIDVLCGVGQPQLFTAYKNVRCGSTTLWDIDTAIAQKITTVNDTTISVTFKNINWQGKVYAALTTGVCVTPLFDSMSLHIVNAPAAPDLGPDTVLCTGNTLILHAGVGFKTYQWQDGSADSTFSVTSAGDYSVAVSDYCGNTYNPPVVHVTPAHFDFSAGGPFQKCNGDTVQLTATGGFTNYKWLPGTNLQTGAADSIVQVFPDQDVDYSVQAVKRPGCTVTTTVHITVNHSPTIQLGKDTSFCYGGQTTLDAGGGFSMYQWSTGALSQRITVGQAGMYSVIGTAANGCRSYDTLAVAHIYPLPDFALSISGDTSLCQSQLLTYGWPANGSAWQWSDGSTSNPRTIDQPGRYGLTVTSAEGCVTSHSINVHFLPSPVVALGNDTVLCNGTSRQLDATNPNATYAWQDGSIGPQYTIRTPGMYFVKVTIDGCSTSDSIRVDYLSAPVLAFAKDTFLCQGEKFVLMPQLNSPVQYLWQDGSTADQYLVKDTGLYTLTATNVCGSGKAAIHVNPGLCKLAMPSAFTPNQDGRNDLFRVKYPFAVSQFYFVVYDIYGMKVFETKNIREGWNGTYHGKIQPIGTYVWYVTLTGSDKTKQSMKGTVVLMR